MIYENIKSGVFISRPNRFIAFIDIEGKAEKCHVKNTGRCRELLLPGARVYVQESKNSNRSTKYDLISVYKGDRLINMDSQAPNKVVAEWLASGGFIEGITFIKPEAVYHKSRFDFYIEIDVRKMFIEVKGVTLEENGVAMFPDAPTQRGLKHLQELIRCKNEEYEAAVIFVIQMPGMVYFTPNIQTHPEFGACLKEAENAGVIVKAIECSVGYNSITAGNYIPIII